MEKLLEDLNKALEGKLAFLNISVNKNLGLSIYITASMDKKEDWQNQIFMNSRFLKAHIFNVNEYGQTLQYKETGLYSFEISCMGMRDKKLIQKKKGTHDEILKHVVKQLEKLQS